MEELLREFVGETLDMMEAVASDLVVWEADPSDRSGLDQIFRTVHTVKGSSSFFELPRVTAIAHAAEELLESLRARRREPDPPTVAIVLLAFDHIRELVLTIASDGIEPTGDDTQLLAKLTADVRKDDLSKVLLEPLADVLATSGEPAKPAIMQDEASGRNIPVEWRSVRVPLLLLDEVMSGVSDLVLARNEVNAQLRRAGVDIDGISAFERLSTLLVGLRSSVSLMRMVPLRQMLSPFSRMVRGVASELDKQVRLVTHGAEVELDREVIEGLRDPIVHILRNAIDHGIEPSDIRVASGKPATATLTITGQQTGNRISITIEDDGAGLAEESIVKRAIAVGHIQADQAAKLTPDQIAALIFMPGLSTSETVTDISGRGVGMDVVKANVEKLGGSIRVTSRKGLGVSLTIDVPMTLTIISALAIEAGGQGFAIPRSQVEEVMLCSNDALQRVESGGATMIRVRGRLYPLLVIEELLGVEKQQLESEDRAIIICRVSGQASIALDVPDVRDHNELVIKPLPPMLLALGLYNGFSLPDSGQPMLILDIDAIARHRISGQVAAACASAPVPESHEDNAPDAERWLCFRGWSSAVLRALPLGSIDRLVDVPAAHIKQTGRQLIAHVAEQLYTVFDEGFEIPDSGSVRMICLNDGAHSVLIPTLEISYLAALSPDMALGERQETLLGLTMFDGQIVEMVDPYRLLCQVAVDSQSPLVTDATDRAVIWIVDSSTSGWSKSFLAPSLSAAGYVVHIVADHGAVTGRTPKVIVLGDDVSCELGEEQNLKIEFAGQTQIISAYDRAGLMTALRARGKGA